MKIKDMFEKDINREITGVVKVAQRDEEEVYKELEEYVVTNELKGHFDDFFEAYKESIEKLTDKMGVWISGFFGSGKSHFLKILSYILENREVRGKKAIDFFENKIDDQFILGNMEKSSKVENEVILFNIDSKSESDIKSDKEAIVKVFMKVFNEHRGYCGSIPWLADLEMKLDRDGDYEAFKDEFRKITGDSWEQRREDFFFEEEAIIKSLVATTRMNESSARNWYEKAEDNYSLSIEKFAKRVNSYIENKDGDNHVVFLVDEVGQYIGDDEQLMLNLQTVTEDLGTHCGGKAWVVVTSQEAMDKVISRIREMDFSKIMGRFNTRLNLSSANVDEVIMKRLLKKNDTAEETLRLLYNDKDAVLNNLISFSETYEMKNYSGENEFINVYPFIPYQFKLLQEVFEEIRRHGASGKHLAEGERSLLSAFQESAQEYQNKEDGKLVPFSAFFTPIKSFLDSNVRRVITKAQENNNLVSYDVEILKLLFLIRYIEGVPGNIENLTTLMISDMEEDKLALKKKIKQSLNRLMKETLIQKNGNKYFFLTDEEQDVNREIESTRVDTAEIVQKVGEYIFEDIYTDRKFTYSEEYEFGFNKIVDTQNRGRQTDDIGIRIITPYYERSTESELLMKSQGEDNIFVKLSGENDFIGELEQALKVETYLRTKSRSDRSVDFQDIISRIEREQIERKTRVKELLTESISESDIFVRGRKLDLNKLDAKKKIDEGLEILVEEIYDKLHYIKEHVKFERELEDLLDENKLQLDLAVRDPNHLAIDEVKVYIKNQAQRNVKITMKKILDKFTSPGCGWQELDIAAILIKLMKVKEINLQYEGERLNADNRRLVEYLTKKKHFEKLVIEKRTKIDEEMIKKAQKLGRNLFEETNLPSDEDSLYEELTTLINNNIINKARGFQDYYQDGKPYPGEEDLREIISTFEQIYNIRDLHAFFNEITDNKEDLAEHGRKLDLIRGFFNNQKVYFDRALIAIELYDKNETYILDEKIIDKIEELKSIVNDDEPYSRIKDIPDLRDKFNNKFVDLIDEKCRPVENKIKADKNKVKSEIEKRNFDEKFKENLLSRFDRLLERLREANIINEISAMKEESETIKKRCFNEIKTKIKQKKEQEKENGETEEIDDQIDEPEVVYISPGDIFSNINSIENEEQIDEFLTELRNKLKKYLDEDKNIQFI